MRPALFFRPDQEYLGFPDFVDPLCAHLDAAASLPAMNDYADASQRVLLRDYIWPRMETFLGRPLAERPVCDREAGGTYYNWVQPASRRWARTRPAHWHDQ